jgi:hypothetical protein
VLNEVKRAGQKAIANRKSLEAVAVVIRNHAYCVCLFPGQMLWVY